jgi:hypothetical protein
MNKKLVSTRIGNVYGVQKTEVQALDNITQPTELVVVIVVQNLDCITVKQVLTIWASSCSWFILL